MSDNCFLEQMAEILSYPTEQIRRAAGRLYHQELDPDGAQAFKPFYDYVDTTPLKDIEELFTKTFDLNPSCCLEVGWHLYGEDYARGAFLVHMRQSLAEEHLPESVELPDHISHCLRLLARLEPDDAVAFVHHYMQPAMAKILQAMERQNPYTGVMEALQHELEQRYGVAEQHDDETPESKLIELPVLNNAIYYNNIEDAACDEKRG